MLNKDAERSSQSSEKRILKVRLSFKSENQEATVDIDTSTGCVVNISGSLWPTDVEVVASVVKTLKDNKGFYKPDKEE